MEENINITPEMISNFINMFKNDVSSNSNTSFESNKSNKNNINNSYNFSNSSFENRSNNSFNSYYKSKTNHNYSLDFETILRVQKIFEKLNGKNDPRSNLLYSLKPFLGESQQKELDQYINLFKIIQIVDLLK